MFHHRVQKLGFIIFVWYFQEMNKKWVTVKETLLCILIRNDDLVLINKTTTKSRTRSGYYFILNVLFISENKNKFTLFTRPKTVKEEWDYNIRDGLATRWIYRVMFFFTILTNLSLTHT